MDIRTLSEIWIYPIKSLAGIRMQTWEVKQKGLLYDRRWMLIDEQGNFMTQRTTSRMALFKTELKESRFTVSFNNDSIAIPLDHNSGSDSFQAIIWDDTVEVIEVDQKYSQWFSEKLEMPCRLVYFPEQNKRAIDPRYVSDRDVSLADGYPFLIIGEQSLQDLNNRLETKMVMKRFRPNFVFTGGLPFEEDTWKNFTIGDIEFMGVKPCARCNLTTINPETGEKGAEPLKTLATYRASNNKILFGENLIALNEGRINVGDNLTIKSNKE